LTPDGAQKRDQLQSEAEGRVVEMQSETEAEVVSAVLADLRENPGDYMGEE